MRWLHLCFKHNKHISASCWISGSLPLIGDCCFMRWSRFESSSMQCKSSRCGSGRNTRWVCEQMTAAIRAETWGRLSKTTRNVSEFQAVWTHTYIFVTGVCNVFIGIYNCHTTADRRADNIVQWQVCLVQRSVTPQLNKTPLVDNDTRSNSSVVSLILR